MGSRVLARAQQSHTVQFSLAAGYGLCEVTST